MGHPNEGNAFEKLLGFLWGDGAPINITKPVFTLKVLANELLLLPV